MSEERRRTRKKLSVLKGVLYTAIGFFFILIPLAYPVSTAISRTDLVYILCLLYICVTGVLFTYWALEEFLSAYKEKDALMDVALMADFHIGRFQSDSSLRDFYICKSHVRNITGPKRNTVSKIPPDTDCSL